MWCLARSAHRNIAYGNDGNIVGAASQNTQVEELVPKTNAYAVAPTQGLQPFVDFDEIAFSPHAHSSFFLVFLLLVNIEHKRHLCLQNLTLIHVFQVHERNVKIA